MILICDFDSEFAMSIRLKFHRLFALNTYSCTPDEIEDAVLEHRADAIYIPRIETIFDPIDFCRRLKTIFPKIPLITPLPKQDSPIPYDELYPVTDNIPLLPIPFVRLVEIITELRRLYTGRDHMLLTAGPVSLHLHSFTIAYAARLLSLTAIQLSILRYAAEAYPNHVTAADLCRYAGCPNRPLSPKALQSVITAMNGKVERIAGFPILFSRYGVGYKISPRPFRASKKK